MMKEFACLVCENLALEPVPGFEALPRVTSDCKPFERGGRLFVCDHCGAIQKTPDAMWLSEIDRIYRGYEIYQLSQGTEQLIFSGDGAATPRSNLLVDFMMAHAKLPSIGRLIDIGCGNGAALANFSAALPRWELYGSELSDKGAEGLKRLQNFKQLFTVLAGQIPGTFDLVSMIHSLEHMRSPSAALAEAAELLTGEGALLVEVPDVETSPFDLVVVDHLMHFSVNTLNHLAHRCDLRPSFLSNTMLPKEITLLANKGGRDLVLPPAAAERGKEIAEGTVRWLGEIVSTATAMADTGAPFGIFGTSISGMWLYGSLSHRVDFFVDEDTTRIGRKYEGKPILSPQEAPAGSNVYIPLAPSIARQVLDRLSAERARFVTPPLFAGVSAQTSQVQQRRRD